MKFIDYIYYRISAIYIKKYNENQGYLYGMGVIFIMALLHIYMVVLTVAINFSKFNDAFFGPLEDKNYLHSWTTIPTLLILIFIFFIFNKKRYLVLDGHWSPEDKIKRNRRGWAIFFYLSSIFIITIALAIYRKKLGD